jgi:hypothetical protein
VRWLALVVLAACGGTAAPRVTPPPAAADPGAVLIELEEKVWRLEGLLIGHVDAALRTPEARAAIGDDDRVRDGSAEAAIRAFLRASYPAEIRAVAAEVLLALDADTRRYLDRIGRVVERTPDEIMLEYLTYDGLFDLAAMRHGYRQWKAGRYDGPAAVLAASFFGESDGEPSASRGIEILRADRRVLEISVFGGRVLDEIQEVAPGQDDAVEVVWRSNYEQLRESIRGGESAALDREVMGPNDGGHGVSYRAELGEYLRSSTAPWASVLYLVPVDEAADLFAGVASGGDLETRAAPTAAGDALPREGWIGEAGQGVSVRIVDVQPVPSVATTKPTRTQFVSVVVEIRSELDTELRLLSTWFSLETPRAEYPEIGVLRPGLAPELARRFGAARAIELPYRRLAAGATTTIALVFDVPPGDHGVLHVGNDELRLAVGWTP